MLLSRVTAVFSGIWNHTNVVSQQKKVSEPLLVRVLFKITTVNFYV